MDYLGEGTVMLHRPARRQGAAPAAYSGKIWAEGAWVHIRQEGADGVVTVPADSVRRVDWRGSRA